MAARGRRRRLLLRRRRRQLAAEGDPRAAALPPQQGDGQARVDGDLDRRDLRQDVGGAAAKFKAALAAIAEAWEEAAELGLLDDGRDGEPRRRGDARGSGEDGRAPPTRESEPTDAAAFHAQRRKALRAKLRAKIAELRASARMNDRAAPARKAARLARGGDGSGGDGDVADDPTCAHHAVANIGEEGRKAID